METNNEKKSGNKLLMILSGVLFLLVLFLGYQLYNQKNATEMVTAEKEKVDTEYAATKSELAEVQKAYDGLQTDNKQLQSELDAKKEELEDIAAQLEKEKGNRSVVARLKKELETIRGLIKGYLKDIDSLQLANKLLTEENTVVKADLSTEKGKSAQLEADKQGLNEKVALGSRLVAANLFADAMRGKIIGSKEVSTTKASRADKLRAVFTLAENRLAKAEEKTVYMKVTSPDGQVLSNGTDDANMFTIGGEKQLFSSKKNVEYTGKGVEVSMYFDKKTDFKVGKYNVEIYVDGASIGSTSFDLK